MVNNAVTTLRLTKEALHTAIKCEETLCFQRQLGASYLTSERLFISLKI